MASVKLHDPVDDGEPEARAVALRRDEGVENPLQKDVGTVSYTHLTLPTTSPV